MTNHSEISQLLPLYDVVTAEQRADVDAHIESCPACKSELALYGRIDDELAHLPLPWPDRAARSRIHAAIAQPVETPGRVVRQVRLPRGLWVATAAIAVALLLVAGLSAVADGRFDPRLALQGRNPFLVVPPAPTGVAAARLARSDPDATPMPDPSLDAAAQSNPVAWIKQNAIPLNTSQPGGGFADLMPLRDVIRNARVVALGDSAYGTHESMAMKQRILEFLVDQMGFNTVVVEASQPQADLINRYIQTGLGDPDELALLQTGGFRQTEELLYTVRWLRNHNEEASRSSRIGFRGFDIMQQYSHFPYDQVVAYLKKVDPDAVSRAYGDDQELFSYMLSKRSDYTSRSSWREYGDALLAVRALMQYDAYSTARSPEQRAELRAQGMADNVDMLLRRAGPHGKIILWGHNETLAVNKDANNLGARLRQKFGSDLVVLGSTFYRGSLDAATRWPGSNALRMALHQVPPAVTGSYEDYFQQTGLERFVIDLHRPASGPVAEWLAAPHLLRNIGSSYNDCNAAEYFQPVRLAEQFDAFIYLGNASPATVLFQTPLAARTNCS